MKLLAFADLHIHSYKYFDKDGSRLKNCLRVLDIVFKSANSKNYDAILFAGDLFDQQKSIPIKVINETFSKFKSLFEQYDIKFICVSGNHDYGTKKIIDQHIDTSIDFLTDAFPNKFIKIDDTFIDIQGTRIYGIPYYEFPEHYYEMANRFSRDSYQGKKLLMTHATVIGYNTIPGHVDATNESFDYFDMVVSGDIHHSKWITDKFLMLGSPLHKDQSDVDSEKGIWTIEINDKISTTFHSLKSKFPNFVIKNEGEEITKEDENNYVILQPVKQVIEEGKVDINIFDSYNKPEDLVTSYWNLVDGKDETYLQVGLDLLI